MVQSSRSGGQDAGCFRPQSSASTALFLPPALGERRHRRLARLCVAVRRRAVLVVPEGERPSPRRPYRGRMYLQDTTDYGAIGKHVVVILIPLMRAIGLVLLSIAMMALR